MKPVTIFLIFILSIGMVSAAEWNNFSATEQNFEGNFSFVETVVDWSDYDIKYGIFADSFDRENGAHPRWTGISTIEIRNETRLYTSNTNSYIAARPNLSDGTIPFGKSFILDADMTGGRSMLSIGTSYDNAHGGGAWPDTYWMMYRGSAIDGTNGAGRPSWSEIYNVKIKVDRLDETNTTFTHYGNNIQKMQRTWTGSNFDNIVLKAYGTSMSWYRVHVYNLDVDNAYITSNVIDAGPDYYGSKVQVMGNLNKQGAYNTSLEYRKSSNNIDWSDWLSITNENDVESGVIYEFDGSRYYQVRTVTGIHNAQSSSDFQVYEINIGEDILYPNIISKSPNNVFITSYENYDLDFSITLNEPCITEWHINGVLQSTSSSTSSPTFTFTNPTEGEYTITSTSQSENGVFVNTWYANVLMNTYDIEIIQETPDNPLNVVFQVSNLTSGIQNLHIIWSNTTTNNRYILKYYSSNQTIQEITAESNGYDCNFTIPLPLSEYMFAIYEEEAVPITPETIITIMITSVVGVTLYMHRTKIKTTLFEIWRR